MRFGDVLAYGFDDLISVDRRATVKIRAEWLAPVISARRCGVGRFSLVFLHDRFEMSVDFCDYHHLLLAIGFDREGRATPLPYGRVTLFDGQFNILRVVIAPRDDHHILDAPGDVQLTISHESQVSGAEERAVARVSEARPEGALVVVRPLPVSTRHAGAGDPDLADSIGRAEP